MRPEQYLHRRESAQAPSRAVVRTSDKAAGLASPPAADLTNAACYLVPFGVSHRQKELTVADVKVPHRRVLDARALEARAPHARALDVKALAADALEPRASDARGAGR